MKPEQVSKKIYDMILFKKITIMDSLQNFIIDDIIKI